MPYIDALRRRQVYTGDVIETPGELNYVLTAVCMDYLEHRQRAEGMSYTHLNDIVGALESAKLEFYRRVVVPYEDKKCADNGDVYTP